MLPRRLPSAPISGQHVGPVGEEGDPPEALGLALGAEHSAGCVEAHQLGVGGGIDLDLGLDGRRVARDVDDELRRLRYGCGRLAVHLDRDQLEPVAIEPQRPVRARRCARPQVARTRFVRARGRSRARAPAPASRAADNPRGGSRHGSERRRFRRGLASGRWWCGHRPWPRLRAAYALSQAAPPTPRARNKRSWAARRAPCRERCVGEESRRMKPMSGFEDIREHMEVIGADGVASRHRRPRRGKPHQADPRRQRHRARAAPSFHPERPRCRGRRR